MKESNNKLEVKLKKLNRNELLQLLLERTRENEELREEIAELRKELDDRILKIGKAGNLANAMINVNGVLEAAQKAADQYLENIAAMEAETKLRCEEMIKQAENEANEIRLRKKLRRKK